MTDKQKLDAIKAEIHRLVDVRGYDREMANDLLAFMNSLPNEPVSEDLEQAIDKYLATYFGGEIEKQEWPFMKKMAIHFAEWQKQKDANLIFNAKEDGYRLGLATMKQQMMKEAVKVKITNSCIISLPSDCYFKVGDKVLIIKEG
jgi:hypothetical protein